VIDPALPGLRTALDPAAIGQRLGVRVDAVEVLQHKAGRRCVVAYETDDGPLVGKLRAGHRATTPFRLMQRFTDSGFGADAPDGIIVAQPVAVLEDLQMWVQTRVSGRPAHTLLRDPGTAVDVARRAAAVANKIHGSGVPARRRHLVGDELRVLRDRLEDLARDRPSLAARLRTLMRASEQRAAAAGDLAHRGGPRGIHRDFYAEQLVVDGPRVAVLDFDLYCEGDPALDIGNFLGHLTEHALRTMGSADALADAEAACRDTFADLAGEQHRAAVDVYADLTLVRHVALSHVLPGRSRTTDDLLALCEQRLGLLTHR
jgi:aminoglycoside phosphotransferase (APT) family kinase protein